MCPKDDARLPRSAADPNATSDPSLLELLVRERTAALELEVEERRRAEAQLRASEAKFSLAFHSSPMALLITASGEDRILEANQAFGQLFGYAPDEIWEHALRDFDLMADVDLRREIRESVYHGEGLGEVEAQFRRKSGETFWGRLSIQPISLDGRACHLIMLLDIDKEKRSAAEREKLLEDVWLIGQRLSWALQAGPGGAWDWDLLSGRAWWSPEMYDLWKVPRDTPMETADSMAIVHPDDRDFVEREIAKAIAEHSAPKYEFRVIRPDGVERWMLTSGRVMYDEAGKAIRIIGITLDISDRKKEEAELKEHRENLEVEIRARTEDLEHSRRAALSLMQDANIQRQRAEKALEDLARSQYELILARDEAMSANKAKSDFLATMSHEIRTPMNAVAGLAFLLLKTSLEPKQKEYVHKIMTASTGLQRIIDDTLDLSKIEAGRLEIEDIDFRLDTVLEELASVLHAKAQAKGLRLVFDTAADVPRALHGDPFRLEQVLLNLADNSVKFTESGEITLTTRVASRRDDGVVLKFSVKDTGIGMTEGQMSRLFQPFTQADATTTRKYGGTGLGLAISKRLVEMMKGTISVQSEPGQGAEFAFTAAFGLAHAPLEATVSDTRAVVRGAPSLAGVRVLLVEDNEFNREVSRELLESEGCRVDLAPNGEEAVRLVRPGAYDVVLMDIQMPVMDGLEATRLIRSEPALRGLPILSMTADVMSGDVETYHRAGMNDNISKPIDPPKLFETLARWTRPGAEAAPPGRPRESDVSALGELRGLDTASGLARLSGNVRLYRKLLLKFRSRYKQAANRVQKAFENGELDVARQLTHTLKGVSGNIGALELHQAASDLDLALRTGTDAEQIEALASMARSMSVVLDSIARLEMETVQRPKPASAAEPAVLGGLLEKMLRLAQASDMEALDLVPELERLSAGADGAVPAGRIREALECFRFEEAQKLLAQAAGRLKSPDEGKE